MLKRIAKIFDHGTDWQPVVHGAPRAHFINAPATFSPLMMKKRDESGNWIYREPTQAEVEDFMSSEAW